MAASDNITGAFYALCTPDTSVGPMSNIPPANKRGWDFALWYAFCKAAKVTDSSEYFSIPRVTSILAADTGSWGPGRKLTDVDRLQTLIRLCAQSKNVTDRIASPKKFLKAEGFFMGKLLGKKPVQGIYTADELVTLEQEWTERKGKIAKAYGEIPENFSGMALGDTLNDQLKKLHIGVSSAAKQVEEVAHKRIPELLISEGRGTKARKTIAKGSSLSEKLLNINGGDSVRTIAKVMWTPQCGLSQTQFADITMSVAKSKNVQEEDIFSRYDYYVSNGESLSEEQLKVMNSRAWVNEATEVYMEIIPDRAGSAAWDSTFGIRKKQ